MNLFSVPHTISEDLARQPGIAVRNITPGSVREFLRRSPSDITRRALVDFFATAATSTRGSNAAGDGGGSPGSEGRGRHSQAPDIDLLLELLTFCLSDCPALGERPALPLPPSEDERTGGRDDDEGNDAEDLARVEQAQLGAREVQ